MRLPAGAHGGEVALDRRVARAFREQPGDAVLGFAGLLCGFAIELVQAASAMGVQGEAGRGLRGQGIAQRQQDDVLEHVRVVAGVEGVAIIHPCIVGEMGSE